ncbi:MAG TPA: carboxypeptidase regulatory-like domain-containing protein [Acidobacteria bacterium]|nr:carboxypeptidase regulatory-like domain-containing protein [Acidobacteriota bacterium]
MSDNPLQVGIDRLRRAATRTDHVELRRQFGHDAFLNSSDHAALRGRIGIIDCMGGSRYDLSARVARLGVFLGVCTLAATFSAGGQPTTGSIVGRLVDTSTGDPIVDGVLVLREFTSREQRLVHTDAEGEFRLVDLPAAVYSLHATALGYVGREYGQRHPMESGVPIELAVGENRADLVVPLPPGGTITGRVTTPDGQPLASADVGALRPRIDGDRRRLVPMGRTTSNGRGEFRIAGLPPGHYYVAAIDPGDERTEDTAGRMQTAQTFFPGVSNAATAERVQLSFGGTRADIDFTVAGAPTVTVRGQLVNPDGIELATASVTMAPESNDGLGLGVANATLTRPDGSFEFANVPPGDYRLRAIGRTSQSGPTLFGSFEFFIRDADVGNAVVFLNPGARLFGQVDIADGATTLAPEWANCRSARRWLTARWARDSRGVNWSRMAVSISRHQKATGWSDWRGCRRPGRLSRYSTAGATSSTSRLSYSRAENLNGFDSYSRTKPVA